MCGHRRRPGRGDANLCLIFRPDRAGSDAQDFLPNQKLSKRAGTEPPAAHLLTGQIQAGGVCSPFPPARDRVAADRRPSFLMLTAARVTPLPKRTRRRWCRPLAALQGTRWAARKGCR